MLKLILREIIITTLICIAIFNVSFRSEISEFRKLSSDLIKHDEKTERLSLNAKTFYNINEAIEFYENLSSDKVNTAQIVSAPNTNMFIIYY